MATECEPEAIELLPSADKKPVAYGARHYAPHVKSQLLAHLDGLESHGLIEEGDPHAEWIGALLAVPKPNDPNGEVRLTTDLTNINPFVKTQH